MYQIYRAALAEVVFYHGHIVDVTPCSRTEPSRRRPMDCWVFDIAHTRTQRETFRNNICVKYRVRHGHAFDTAAKPTVLLLYTIY